MFYSFRVPKGDQQKNILGFSREILDDKPVFFPSKIRPVFLGALLLSIFWPVHLLGGNWPNFRGPNFNGSNEDKNTPTWISKQNHVKWTAELPGTGTSTPAVWKDSVFLTSVNKEANAVLAIKINLYSGKIEWSHLFSEGERHDSRSDLAAPSPTTNGQEVIFLSGNGDLVCFNFSGTRLWQKNLQKEYGQFSIKWTYSSSPMLFGDSLFVQIIQRDESIDGIIPGQKSVLLAFDPKTGKQKWKHQRRALAAGESMEAYSSPIPLVHQNRREILVSGADCLTGHDPETGKEIWRWGTWNRDRKTDWRVISSPVYGDDMITACAPKGQPVYTFFAGAKGTIKINDLRWKSVSPDLSCDITSPLYYKEYFYFLNGRKKILSCVEPYSGKIEWSESIPVRSKIEASPTASDGKIFVMSNTGEIYIYKAGVTPQLLHSTVLGQDVKARNRATIVPAVGRLFIRVGTNLWCMD